MAELATFQSRKQFRTSLGLAKKGGFKKIGFSKGKISKEERSSLGKAGRNHHWTEWMKDGESFYVRTKNAPQGNFVKKVGRIHATILAKGVRVVTPVLAAAGTLFLGPGLGLAITAAGATIARIAGATAARAKGYRGRDARNKGRSLMRQTLKYGALGTGVGFAGGLVAGGSALTGLAGASAASAAPSGAAAAAAGVAPSGGSGIVTTLGGTAATTGGSLAASKLTKKSGDDKMDGFVSYNDVYGPNGTLANPGAAAAGTGFLGDAASLFRTGAGVYQMLNQDPAAAQRRQQQLAQGWTDTNGDGVLEPPSGGLLGSIPGPILLVGGILAAWFAWKMIKKAA